MSSPTVERCVLYFIQIAFMFAPLSSQESDLKDMLLINGTMSYMLRNPKQFIDYTCKKPFFLSHSMFTGLVRHSRTFLYFNNFIIVSVSSLSQPSVNFDSTL